MFKKIVTATITVVLIVGCEPTPHVEGRCYMGGLNASNFLFVSSNLYKNDIVMERYSVTYKNGVLLKKSEGNVTVPSMHDTESTKIMAASYREKCDLDNVADFSSFMTIAHLDENTTYTMVGFTEEMDQEYNITEGKKVDIYGLGYLSGINYSDDKFVPSPLSEITLIDITQTGEFTFTAGE